MPQNNSNRLVKPQKQNNLYDVRFQEKPNMSGYRQTIFRRISEIHQTVEIQPDYMPLDFMNPPNGLNIAELYAVGFSRSAKRPYFKPNYIPLNFRIQLTFPISLKFTRTIVGQSRICLKQSRITLDFPGKPLNGFRKQNIKKVNLENSEWFDISILILELTS